LVGSFDASSGDFAILARLDQIIRIQGLFFFLWGNSKFVEMDLHDSYPFSAVFS
jgi:hypothetical protein